MGCGSSSATGRDHYKTLSPEPESLTPLFSAGDDNQRIPRLDSFIIAPPAESPTPSKPKSKYNRPTVSPVATAAAEKDPFDDFPTPKNFDTNTNSSFNTSFNQQPGLFANNNNNNQHDDNNAQEIEDDAISFPSLPDSPLAASSAAKAAGRGESLLDNHPPPPTPPTQLATLSYQQPQPPPSILVSAQQSQASSSETPSKKEHHSKKKKKKRSKSIHKSTKASSKKEVTEEEEEEVSVDEMARAQRPEDTPKPDSTSGMRFDELYRLRGVLGTGAFSTVREGYHRNSEAITYAVKCVNRRKLTEEDEAALLDEVSILKELRHVHIIRLYDFFSEASTYYLVMERMSGGELFDRIVAKAYYSEKEARDVCKIVLEAVGFCHGNNVAHRDLKPENLLLLSEDDDSAVKIADFGFAKKVYAPNSLTTQCGTPGYVSPEILEGLPYDTRADMWSVGVILYILLGGYPPFIENNQRDLFRKIRRGDYEFHEEYWGTVSSEAKELISSLLTVDPNARLDATQALENAWIRVDDDVLAQRDLGGAQRVLTTYNAKRKFKAAVSTIMAVNKLQSLGKDFLTNLS